MSEHLFPKAPRARMTHLANVLAGVAEAGMSLTTQQIAAVSGYIERQAEATVIRRHLERDIAVRVGESPERWARGQELLAKFDAWAAEFIGESPGIPGGQAGKRC